MKKLFFVLLLGSCIRQEPEIIPIEQPKCNENIWVVTRTRTAFERQINVIETIESERFSTRRFSFFDTIGAFNVGDTVTIEKYTKNKYYEND